ncbi:MAG TPA: PASTA domain-containing protein [Candidatus Fournierella excrementavium]|nr:PASTA domain-containing protein [Candidatus Fournierella excrementavium]
MNKNTNEPSNGVNRSLKVRSYVLLGLFLVVGCGVLIWRLYTWQIVRHDEMLNAAASQQMKDMTITPQRGQIYDATGKVLAKSSIVWTITADPSQIKAPGLSKEELKAMGGAESDESKAQRRADRVQSISEDLAGILSMEAQEIYDKLIDSSKQYVLLAKQVDKPVADEISQYASDNKLSLIVSQDTKREYPFGAFAASVLGFMHADGYGFYGLEQYYEDVLAGTPGRLVSQRTPTGGEVANDDRVLYEAKDGDNLILTLDAEIQAIAEKYLENSVKVNNVSERGVVIVMDVNTGAILAMATKPDFDPNDPMTIYDPERAALLEGLDGEEYTKVQGEERQRQWKNKTITDLYTPGSVFKLVTTSALLDSGAGTVNSSFNCVAGGYTVLPGTKPYQCADNGYGVLGVHGWQTPADVLANSCNQATIQEALLMGKEIFSDYYTAFGFTETTGIDLPAEQYPYEGISYHPEESMSAVDLASSSFGQAQKVTPIQMATAVCAVVNGGYLVQPHIVSKIVDNEGNVVEEFEPTAKRQVISEETSAALRQMMEAVVGGGADGAAGRNAYVAGYHIGGKSGTSEKLDRPKADDPTSYEKVSSFVGVVPIDDPEILVLAFVDEPHAETEFGSMLSAPLVGNIISEVAPYLGIETDPSLLPTGNVTVPNLVNPSNPSYQQWDMAQVELNKKGFAHRRVGTGELVLAQSPAAGEKVPAGSTVYLFTDSADIPTVTVPSVVGKSAALGKQILSAAGLNASLSAEEGTVTAQSVAENTEARMGSVIELTVSGAEG